MGTTSQRFIQLAQPSMLVTRLVGLSQYTGLGWLAGLLGWEP
jgi:hypothetical protein